MAAPVDPVAQMRYLASIKRQSAPPRCNPFAIVIQVLALGMVFIGLTMTIIANWPGATTIGENPLKIAGPVLLAVGFSVFLIGIIVVCILNKRERARWEQKLIKIAASRPQLDPAQNTDKPETVVTAQPHEVRKSAPIYTGSGNVADAPSSTNDWSRDESFDNNGDDVPDAVRVKKTRRQRRTEQTDEGATTTTTTVVTTTTEHEERSKRPKPPAPPPTAARDHGGESDSLLRHDDRSAAVSSSPGESRRLRVHVKALPGSTVRIQQGSTGSGRPPVAPKPAFAAHNQSTGSAETDI